MGSSNNRRDARYRCSLPVVLAMGRARHPATTEDVSFSGLFVAGPVGLGVRQLAVVELELPDAGPLVAHAMVVFSRAARDGRPAGAGLKFYGLDRADLARWSGFVRQLRERGDAGAPVEASDRRRHARAAVVLKVRPQGMDGLVELYTRDLSESGMFVETDQPLLVGSRVTAEVVHPDTGESFEVACIVRRIATDPEPGVAVEFTDLDPARREELHRFVSSAMPAIVIEDPEES